MSFTSEYKIFPDDEIVARRWSPLKELRTLLHFPKIAVLADNNKRIAVIPERGTVIVDDLDPKAKEGDLVILYLKHTFGAKLG